jgi:thiosulfate reductase cytochrome b subunit
MPPTASQPTVAVPRHSVVVRATHWLTVIAFFALLISGLEILISHPRFYWGETGNVMTKPLFTLPIPSSRDTVPTAYKFVMPDQNGWSRYLHFQAAWLVILTGAVYVIAGLWSGHFLRHLLPPAGQRNLQACTSIIKSYLRGQHKRVDDPLSYNVLQRTTYLFVIFVLFPLMIWTGLAMSPAFVAVAPWSSAILGGKQSARTLHFAVTAALALFVFVHIAMVVLAGFWPRMRAMTTGLTASPANEERP